MISQSENNKEKGLELCKDNTNSVSTAVTKGI